jgi:hypothetical protein
LEKITGGITMRTLAERHRRVAERAEGNHQFDFAAHEFFEASKEFRKEGRLLEAEETRTQELLVLSKIITLVDSAADLESQASNLVAHAANLSRESGGDPGESWSELHALAASLCEESADRYLTLAGQTDDGARKRDCICKAATELQKAGKNLARAINANSSPEQEQAARDLYWKASRLQSQAAEIPEEDPVHSSETMSTELTLAWLGKGGRMKCRECKQLWNEYSGSSRRHAALARMQESGEPDNEVLNEHVAAAAEAWRIAMRAVLDHEASHQQESARKLGEPNLKEMVPVGRAS